MYRIKYVQIASDGHYYKSQKYSLIISLLLKADVTGSILVQRLDWGGGSEEPHIDRVGVPLSVHLHNHGVT